MQSIYEIRINTLEGEPLSFSSFKGKKILVVNVASACGYTPQYEKLQRLYEKYIDDLVVIGVPCNDFGKQEPGTAEEIRGFCSRMYGITFPLTERVNILTEPKHLLYQFLTEKELNGVSDSDVSWNFQKYLVDENGKFIQSFSPDITPDDERLIHAILN